MTQPPTPEPYRNHEAYLDKTVQLAADSARHGGGPFAAAIVTEDGKEFYATNGVTKSNDPTAHAEVEAIRLACRSLKTFDLSGAILYASGEPCPMCFTAIQWARLDRCLYASTIEEASEAGFDDVPFWRMVQGAVTPSTPVDIGPSQTAGSQYEAWLSNSDRVQY